MRIDRIEFEGAMDANSYDIIQNINELSVNPDFSFKLQDGTPSGSSVWRKSSWIQIDRLYTVIRCETLSFIADHNELLSLASDIICSNIRAPIIKVSPELFPRDERNIFAIIKSDIETPEWMKEFLTSNIIVSPLGESPIIIAMRSDHWLMRRKVIILENGSFWAISSELFPCSEDAVIHIIIPEETR